MTSFRPRASTLLALAALVATSAQAPAAAPSGPPQPTCARPNMTASVLRAVEPDTPPMAQQQGITGTVEVLVDLDELSRVTSTRIRTSPSAVLNTAAIAAARASTYRTEIRDCRPVASQLVFAADFQPASMPVFTSAGARALNVSAVATVTVLPDVAVVSFTVRAVVPAGADPIARVQDAFAAARAKLIAAGVEPAGVVDAGPVREFPVRRLPDPAPSGPPVEVPATSTRSERVEVKVNAMRALPVLRAVRQMPDAINAAVSYGLHDPEPAYRRALAQASADVRARAETAARGAGVRLGAMQQLTVDPDGGVPFGGATMSGMSLDAGGDGTSPRPVQVRAKVTATYAISG